MGTSNTDTTSSNLNMTASCLFRVSAVTPAPTKITNFTGSSGTADGPIGPTGTSYTVSWVGPSNGNTYKGTIIDRASGSQSVPFDAGTSLSATFAVQPGHKYKFTVTPYNVSSVAGPISDEQYFQIAESIPGLPTVVVPTYTSFKGVQVTGATYIAQWISNGAASYDLAWTERDASNAIVGGVQSKNVSGGVAVGTVVSYQIPVQTGKNYRWDVAGCNSAVQCTDVNTRTTNYYFNIATAAGAAPSIPVITGAGTATVNSPYSITLKSTDTDSTNLTYEIAWDTSGNVTPVKDTTATGIQGANSSVATKTYTTAKTVCVRARATDGSNYSGWSQCFSLAVGAAAAPVADLVPEYVALDKASAQPGEQVTVTFRIRNQGTATTTTAFKTVFYLNAGSTNAPNTNNPIGEINIPDLLAPNTSVQKTYTFTMPTSGSSVYSGTGAYALTMFPDAYNTVAEGVREDNNLGLVSGVGFAAVNAYGNLSGTQSITITPAASTQIVGSPFNITVGGVGLPQSARINLSSNIGSISPNYIDLAGGTKTQSVTLTSLGSITITGSISGSSVQGQSSPILVQTGGGGSIFLNQSGTTTLRVIDAAKNSVTGATVEARCSQYQVSGICSSPYTTVTDTQGYARIPANTFPISAGAIFIKITYLGAGGVQTVVDGGKVTLDSLGAYIEKPVNMLPVVTDITPVILVPGIMGSSLKSSGKWSFAPDLPKEIGPDASLLQLHDPIGAGIISFNVVGWENIEQVLVANGYTLGTNIIECPYDFRMPDLEAAKMYLGPCIDKALAKNPTKTKVDIIAHSQGGLLTRGLIQEQGSKYASKIRKIAFVGTPHFGASEAYAPWEGGQLDVTGLAIKGGAVRRDSVLMNYEKVYNKPMTKVCGTKTAPTLLYVPISCTAVSLYTDPNAIDVPDPLEVKKYMENYSPSVKQLLPVYSFLQNGNQTNVIKAPENINEFLQALNDVVGKCPDGLCDDKTSGKLMAYRPQSGNTYNFTDFGAIMSGNNISVKLFYDNTSDKDTLQTVQVGTSGGLVYKDGVPKGFTPDANGDTTVPGISVDNFTQKYPQLPPVVSQSNVHAMLVNGFRKDLASFVSDAAINALTLNSSLTSQLAMTISCPAAVQLTDPSGKKSGVTESGDAKSEILGATLNSENGVYSIAVPNPIAGQFTLTISGQTTGECEVVTSTVQNGVSESKRQKFYKRAGVKLLTFSIK